MSKPISGSTKERVPLSRDRVLAGAITVADAGGIGALTIRTLAQELGVKPMSVYHYVANKDEIIDGIVDLVYAEIDLPVPGGDWRTEMRRRANSARRVLANHPWATPLLQSRLNPGPGDAATPQRLHRHPAGGGLLGGTDRPRLRPDRQLRLRVRPVGERAAHPRPGQRRRHRRVDDGQFFDAEAYPALLEFTMEHIMRPDYDFGEEFEYGLDLILDGLARSLPDNGGAPRARRPSKPSKAAKARSGTPSG